MKIYLDKSKIPLEEFTHKMCLDILKEKKEQGPLLENFFDELEEIQKLRQGDKDFNKFLANLSRNANKLKFL